MTNNDRIVRVDDSLPDLTQVLSRRLLRLTILTLFLGTLLTVTSFACAADLVHWPDCPPGPQVNPYFFTTDPTDLWPAHFQTSPVASPFGGNCSLDVVSGQVMSIATSNGGFAFNTPGEVAGATYTITFDMQWVSGKDQWYFSNQEGDGIQNGLTFQVPYPGNSCWHHYQYTAAPGTNGLKTVMYVYQAGTGPQEMRIANVTMWQADNATPTTPQGVAAVVGEACGSCCEQPGEWTTNAYNSFRVRLPVGKDSDACLTESEGAVINKCNYEVSVVFDSPIIFRKDPIVHYITAQNYVNGTGTVGATCNIWSYDGNGKGKEGTNQTFKPNGEQALNFTSQKLGNTISLLCDLPVGEGISALHWNP